MKVSKTRSITNIYTGERKLVDNEKDFEFSMLSKLTDENLKEKLQSMLTDIDELGKILSDKIDLREFKKYRSKVSEFMNEVVTNSLEFSRDNYLDHRGRLRDYGVVRKIDKLLDEMATELLNKENKNMDVLKKIDEIRGMLLDILT